MSRKAPGKSYREGITLMQLADMFPDENAARKWFEAQVWPEGRTCPRCGSDRTHECSHRSCPYRCTDCRAYFSVKTGTALERSKIPLRKWTFAIYLEVTSLKGVSSMKLHRDLGVTQKTAWFMLHRLREAWAEDQTPPGMTPFLGPVEADETYVGGLRKNMSASKRKAFKDAGPAAGKTAVVGVKDRRTSLVTARVVENTDAPTLQGFVHQNTMPGGKVFTDESRAYLGLKRLYSHEAVNHSVGEYVRDQAHTNGMESFWSMLKRAHKGTFHKISPKHLQRYVNEFAGRHGIREKDTIDQMNAVIAGMVGRRLLYRELVAGEPAR